LLPGRQWTCIDGASPRPRKEASLMSTQFVVQLANRPGALADLTRALAGRGIDLRGISLGGVGDQGYAVLTTSDDAATRAVLRQGGYPYVEGEAVIVEVEDRPGGLAAVAEKLSVAGVDIRGVLFVGCGEGRVAAALTVDDVARARRALGLD
jgi:hypothetical protein